MSRIGRMPIAIPAGVTITIGDGNQVSVKGPKGELTRAIHKDMILEQEDNTLVVKRPSDEKEHRSLHGLTRTLLSNMVIGVTQGFTKTLEIVGVGYRAAKAGKNVALTLGFSHPLEVAAPEGMTLDVPAPNKIVVSGINKEEVGALAAKIRKYREPEPYKGKGVRYEGEVVRRKVGKAGGKGKK
ncbi:MULTISPECIES: 50S ribosomal protein L6 [Pelosinus]|jgi:large subunit ribosomal protein L6|uniref:Large ribosomal subunit protein uL6 n=1 Tax=Pelosinus fermentans B4 TaxID=1149862 RepID=I9L8E2_9FIRM|nr:MULTISPECIES: 50S ribosomal protein L6 [Pelosinus]EIW16536.1 ribosomal protein L6 [Pelosinus fermentans B4]EIW22483.1 ribosomal protein L6 [Pelosinus fermentans A11]OAM95843.1 Ribosomal protein L6, subgroup [Pelosinus fermentans DSM 17108]SDR33442.1 large subunit ribosomal protein L6 [Pelosinus fermentans]